MRLLAVLLIAGLLCTGCSEADEPVHSESKQHYRYSITQWIDRDYHQWRTNHYYERVGGLIQFTDSKGVWHAICGTVEITIAD